MNVVQCPRCVSKRTCCTRRKSCRDCVGYSSSTSYSSCREVMNVSRSVSNRGNDCVICSRTALDITDHFYITRGSQPELCWYSTRYIAPSTRECHRVKRCGCDNWRERCACHIVYRPVYVPANKCTGNILTDGRYAFGMRGRHSLCPV